MIDPPDTSSDTTEQDDDPMPTLVYDAKSQHTPQQPSDDSRKRRRNRRTIYSPTDYPSQTPTKQASPPPSQIPERQHHPQSPRPNPLERPRRWTQTGLSRPSTADVWFTTYDPKDWRIGGDPEYRRLGEPRPPDPPLPHRLPPQRPKTSCLNPGTGDPFPIRRLLSLRQAQSPEDANEPTQLQVEVEWDFFHLALPANDTTGFPHLPPPLQWHDRSLLQVNTPTHRDHIGTLHLTQEYDTHETTLFSPLTHTEPAPAAPPSVAPPTSPNHPPQNIPIYRLAFPNSHILAESLGAGWQHTIEELKTHLKLIASLPLIHKLTPTLPPTTSPETLPNHFSDNITVETRPSDPDWDLPLNTDDYQMIHIRPDDPSLTPTPPSPYYTHPLPDQPIVALHSHDGKFVGTITAARVHLLWQRYRGPPSSFTMDLCSLIQRYSTRHLPKTTKSGQPVRIRNHWATPPSLMEALQRCFTLDTELFASPLNFHPSSTHYYSADPLDTVFGANHDAYTAPHEGSYQSNPEYEYEDLQKAIAKAIRSSLTEEPHLTCLIVPLYEKSSLHKLIHHKNVHTLLTLPARAFSFSSPEAWNGLKPPLTPGTKFDTYILIVSNPSGREKYVTQTANDIRSTLDEALDNLIRNPNTRNDPKLSPNWPPGPSTSISRLHLPKVPPPPPHQGPTQLTLPPPESKPPFTMEVDHTTHKGLLRFPHKQCLVYTDGSLLTDKTPDSTSNDEEPASAGSCIIIPGPTQETPLFQALYTFGGVQDVPKAEMIAITKAPAHLPNLPDDAPPGEGYHIFSDSLSSLQTIIHFINNPTRKTGHRFFARLQELILTVNSRPNKEHFHFHFVRSHIGIEGNEQADNGARRAAQTKYTPRSAEQQPNEDHHTNTQDPNLFDSLHHLKGTDPLPGGATISIQWPASNLPSTHPPEEESKRKTRKILYHLILGLKTHMRSRLHPWTWIHLRDRAKDRWLPLYGSGYTDPFPRKPILHPMSGTLPWKNLSDAKLQILLKCSTGTFFSNSSIHKGPDSHCPLCRDFSYAEPWHHTDGWTHTSRLCRHPTLENMRIKLHNDCVRMVTDAIQHGTYGGCYHFAAVPGHTVKDQRDHISVTRLTTLIHPQNQTRTWIDSRSRRNK